MAKPVRDANPERENSLPVPVDPPTPIDRSHIVEFETRPYIEIRPTDTPINPETAIQAMGHLHARIDDLTRVGVLDHVRRRTQEPVVEWLLVSDGRPDPSIRYLVGSQAYAALDDIRSVLRACFPDTYEFTVAEWHTWMTEETLPIGRPGEVLDVELNNGRAIGTTISPYVSGVQYYARVDRKRDWQTGLRRFDDDFLKSGTPTNSSTHSRDFTESHRVPLSSIIRDDRGTTKTRMSGI
jgi:hypothetical protein